MIKWGLVFLTLCLTWVLCHTDEAGRAAEAEQKKADDLTEDDKIALLGKPKLGDVIRAQIRIKESKEFKVSLYLNHILISESTLLISTTSWRDKITLLWMLTVSLCIWLSRVSLVYVSVSST